MRGQVCSASLKPLVDIWNGLTEVAAVRKFKDRRTAVSRIWKRVQSLEPAAIPQPVATAEPEEAAASAELSTAAISRKDQILALLRAPDGSDPRPDDGRDGWQKHSLPGFLSAVVHKKMALPVHSSKSKDGERLPRLPVTLARNSRLAPQGRSFAALFFVRG